MLNKTLKQIATGNPGAEFWESVRDEFPLSSEYLHFSQFFMVSHPRTVSAAIERHRQSLDRNPFLTIEHGMFGTPEESQVERIYVAAARYLGAAKDEIALIPNTTTGLALVYHGLPLGPEDEVLTTTQEHFTHDEAIRLATQRVGATARKFELVVNSRQPSKADILARVRAAIRPETRVLGLTWVSSQTGLRLPIRSITRLIRRINMRRSADQKIITIVDGTHGFGALEDKVTDLGCDYFISSTHKWIFAPRGTGIIHAKAKAWKRLQPVIPTYYTWDLWQAWADGTAPVIPTAPSHVSPGGFLAYEHQWAMVEAFEFHERIGHKLIADRIHELNGQLLDRLSEIAGLCLYTPRDARWSAGIVCFDVDDMAPAEVVQGLLARRVIASTSPYAKPCVRLSAGIINSPDEVDNVANALAEIVREHRGKPAHRRFRPGQRLGE